jgi:orotate phosphoribosyltransferase
MSKEIAKELLKIKAVFLSPNDPFTWASGIKSPIYCDNRMTLSYPQTRTKIEEAFVKLINRHFHGVDCIVGTATAGIGHAAIIAHLMNLPMAYVRSSTKEHGRQNLIEGHIEKGSKVVVIEDLISTGGSSIKCVDVLKDAGYEVLGVAAIFSYGMQKAKDNFKDIKLANLTDLDSLLEVAAHENYIQADDIQRIKDFRDNPADESWIK